MGSKYSRGKSMPAASVFISYAREDEKWKDRVLKELRFLEIDSRAAFWDDTQIRTGDRWMESLKEALTSSHVAILLVSAAFLSSKFIRDVEMPQILRLEARGTLRIFPVIVRPCLWVEDAWLKERQVLPADKALSELEEPDCDRQLTALAWEISEHLGDSATPPVGLLARSIVGIDIGSNSISAALFDRKFTLPRVTRKYQVKREVTRRSILEQVLGITAELISAGEIGKADLAGIGLGVPGQVDPRTGTLLSAPGFPLARNVQFQRAFNREYPNVPVRVDNDARCAARFELYRGGGRELTDFVCIFVGNGIGSGLVIGKKIHYGEDFCAGEIGHTSLFPDIEGRQCRCGMYGCLEAYATGPEIVKRAAERNIGDQLALIEVAWLADQGNECARKVVEETASETGPAIQSAADDLDLATRGQDLADRLVGLGRQATEQGDMEGNPALQLFQRAAPVTNPVVAARAKEAKLNEHLTPEGLALLAARRNPQAEELVKETAVLLGRGIANLAHIVNPSHVFLGGGVMKSFYDLISDDLEDTIRAKCIERIQVTLLAAQEMELAPTIGAALLFHPDEPWEFRGRGR
jgi:glucokinase